MARANPYLDPIMIGLTQGSEGKHVLELQKFLRRFGYLGANDPNDPYPALLSPAAPEPTPSMFDEATHYALVQFQKCMGITRSGIVDGPTAAFMMLPRCGVPDSPYRGPGRGPGDAWPSPPAPRLRYALANATPDLPSAAVLAAIEEALALWASVTPLSFTRVSPNTDPEILISFLSGDHGDGSPFDGPGNTLAHAFYPPPSPSALVGDAHFDEDERWTVSIPNPPGTTDLTTVAVHEFGHSIGLTHSSDPASVMFPAFPGVRRSLSLDDILRVQGLYGGPAVPPPPPLEPWQDPVIRGYIDEWIRQQDRCVKRVFPGAYVDRWGRLCGRLPTVIAKCNQSPDKPPDWDSYHYLWALNYAPTYYRYTLYQYVDQRRAGASYESLAVCR